LTRRCLCRSLATLSIVALAADRPVHAQGLAGRVALEGIASISSPAGGMNDPRVVLDLVSTVRVADGWDIVLRPWSMRRPGGDWKFEMYQLQVRYVSSTRVPFRVDAGILPSPVGLSTLELQPHRNPLINSPSYYFVPLPAVDGRFDDVRLISGGYPVGAMLSVSGSRWDARGGVTDSSPVQPRNLFSAARPPAQPQLVLGGGVTPIPGMRLGAGFTRGGYRPGATTTGSVDGPWTATVINLEAEYAVGYTRLSGEWVRDRFDMPTGPAFARGFNVQAVHTLSPRIFAAARGTRVTAPTTTIPSEVLRSSADVEAILGYRLTTDLTVRAGYQRQRAYRETEWHGSAVMSVVWADRWW